MLCGLPVDHKGPHGWDYAVGEKAITTMTELSNDLRALGLGWLADRQKLYE